MECIVHARVLSLIRGPDFRLADRPARRRPTRGPRSGALVIGFFMILLDMTIVTVATPAIMAELDAGTNDVLWVTSAYLLAYAVPLLITGRLGDRFGPKWIYLIGLAIFTARLAVVRPDRQHRDADHRPRGPGLRRRDDDAADDGGHHPDLPGRAPRPGDGAVGRHRGRRDPGRPVLGGVLVDASAGSGSSSSTSRSASSPSSSTGAWCPSCRPTSTPSTGSASCSAASAMFLLVFGFQDGEQCDWDSADLGADRRWTPRLRGVRLVGVPHTKEPLVPLDIFRDRNFSVSNVGISAMGLAVTAMGFPLMLYAQLVRGYSALEASLLMAPMAIVSLVMAPVVGRLTDKVHPRCSSAPASRCVDRVFWSPPSRRLRVWQILLPMGLLGLGMAGVWAPLGGDGDPQPADEPGGAGAGVYNATRLVGSVIGSAGIAVLIESRLAAQGLESGGGGPRRAATRRCRRPSTTRSAPPCRRR